MCRKRVQPRRRPGRRLVQLVRHRLEARQEDDHRPADALPDAEDRDRPQRGRRLGEPGDVLLDQPEHVLEEPVQRARLTVVEIQEDERDDDPARDDRQVVHETKHVPARDALVEEQRCAETEHQLTHDGHDRVADGRGERAPEERVTERPGVVVEADEARRLGEVPVRETEQERADQRIRRPGSVEEQSGQEQGVDGEEATRPGHATWPEHAEGREEVRPMPGREQAPAGPHPAGSVRGEQGVDLRRRRVEGCLDGRFTTQGLQDRVGDRLVDLRPCGTGVRAFAVLSCSWNFA